MDMGSMKGLSENSKAAGERMVLLESKRELAISMSRSIIRKTKNMIHAIHTDGEFMTIQGQVKDEIKTLNSKLKTDPEILYSQAVQDCFAEFAEAVILSAIVRKKDMPSFDSLKISPQSWILGLADVIGELRRLTLTCLMKGDMKKAQYYFECMEDIGYEVMGFDVPDALLPVRRKQDIARGVLEKTRSDMATAVMLSGLRKE